MLTKGDKSTDSKGSSLAGVLEMLQEQNRAMQEQHKTQQKMLLDMIEQQREAHEQEMKTLKEGARKGRRTHPKLNFQSRHCRS